MYLPAGSDVAMQTHFHPSGKTEKEQGLMVPYFADKPPSRQLVPSQIWDLKIPASEIGYLLEASRSFSQELLAWPSWATSGCQQDCNSRNKTAEVLSFGTAL